MKKIAIIGTGYVGLITGVSLAAAGNDVTCFDKNKRIVKKLNKELGNKNIRFVTGLSYRHLLILKAESRKQIAAIGKLECTPPHDITGKPIARYLPKSGLLLQLMNESEVLLHEMKTKATMIWPWSQGKAPDMPSFRKKYGLKGAVITAVHLLKGLGKVLGFKVINVPGATGYLDTNYKGKAEYALRALKNNDIVFVHVEAPDEAGHEGDVRKKIRAIEDFDRLVVGTVLSGVRSSEPCLPAGRFGVRILVLPDHPTPIKVMTHTADAVPFAIYPSRITRYPIRITGYNEKQIGKSKLKIKKGHELLKVFLHKLKNTSV